MSVLTQSATELAEMVRSGEVSSRELVEESLARIEDIDTDVNAFTLVDAEGALAAADAIEAGDERPFAGVPTAIKDLAAMKGHVLSLGSDLFGDFTPQFDSHVVRRLREAGFVLVGKTSTPELGILPVTEPRRFGPTRNPWDLGRTPGGSSGGASAAVAAGMVPVAHGSDGGGSIRIPAACTGLFGMKPSRGRISRGPEAGDSFLATDGVLTRTVADSAAILDVMAGYEPGDSTWAPPPAEPFAESAAREPGRLRVALALDPPVEADVDPEGIAAAREAADLLSSLGHDVEEAAPPYPGDLRQEFARLWSVNISAGVLAGGRLAGREPRPEDVEPLTWALHEFGMATPAPVQVGVTATLQRAARQIISWFGDWDVVLTPALGMRPVAIGEIDSCAADPMAEFTKSAAFTPYTAIWNVTGQPGMTLPLRQADDGLPLAVQIVGRPAGEGTLFSLATQIEAARPWADRLAPLAAPV